jgi:NAD(P)H dehydrogenase (quinone)
MSTKLAIVYYSAYGTNLKMAQWAKEATILSLDTIMVRWGAIVVAPGYAEKSIFTAGGNPYGTSVSVNQAGEMVEDVHKAVEHQKTRLLEIAGKLK